jgi:hypothetical protein
MEERSRKRLWEDYVFHFLQKIPPEQIDKQRNLVVGDVAALADSMLAEHDQRWRVVVSTSEGRTEVKFKPRRPQGGIANG